MVTRAHTWSLFRVGVRYVTAVYWGVPQAQITSNLTSVGALQVPTKLHEFAAEGYQLVIVR